MLMKTTPAIKAALHGSDVGIATARLLLQSALDMGEAGEGDESPRVLARKRFINEQSSTPVEPPSRSLPADPIVPTWDKSDQVSRSAARPAVE